MFWICFQLNSCLHWIIKIRKPNELCDRGVISLSNPVFSLLVAQKERNNTLHITNTSHSALPFQRNSWCWRQCNSIHINNTDWHWTKKFCQGFLHAFLQWYFVQYPFRYFVHWSSSSGICSKNEIKVHIRDQFRWYFYGHIIMVLTWFTPHLLLLHIY